MIFGVVSIAFGGGWVCLPFLIRFACSIRAGRYFIAVRHSRTAAPRWSPSFLRDDCSVTVRLVKRVQCVRHRLEKSYELVH